MISTRPEQKRRVLRIAERKLGAFAESRLRGISVLVLLLVARTQSHAQNVRPDANGSISGTIVDSVRKVPLGNATVLLVERALRVTTDSSGMFYFSPVLPGKYTLEVRRVGYVMHTSACSAASLEEVVCNVSLRSIARLDTVRSTAPAQKYMSAALRGFEERRKKGHGYYLAEDELRKNDNRTLPNVLKRIPGIRIVSDRMYEWAASSRTVGDGKTGALQGGSRRNCWVSVYEDGVPVYTGTQQVPDIARYMTRDYAAVEFYAGSASLPAEFSAIRASDCGVLLLWTREH